MKKLGVCITFAIILMCCASQAMAISTVFGPAGTTPVNRGSNDYDDPLFINLSNYENPLFLGRLSGPSVSFDDPLFFDDPLLLEGHRTVSTINTAFDDPLFYDDPLFIKSGSESSHLVFKLNNGLKAEGFRNEVRVLMSIEYDAPSILGSYDDPLFFGTMDLSGLNAYLLTNFTYKGDEVPVLLVDVSLTQMETMGMVKSSPVPVPAAAWLLASGLAGLMGVKRCVKIG